MELARVLQAKVFQNKPKASQKECAGETKTIELKVLNFMASLCIAAQVLKLNFLAYTSAPQNRPCFTTAGSAIVKLSQG